MTLREILAQIIENKQWDIVLDFTVVITEGHREKSVYKDIELDFERKVIKLEAV